MMASIFTFESEVPRVLSPWEIQDLSVTNTRPETFTKLIAEPQEGPVEYKLHLLLRSRHPYKQVSHLPYVSIGPNVQLDINSKRPTSVSLGGAFKSLQLQARQHRLEQLTTQLLWRLQQSSSNHASSPQNIILPALPDLSTARNGQLIIGRLVNGLEESQGALYEIGVADDGTFVGLTDDEMNESLQNLRAMAACLGCEVEVLRAIKVGDAEWSEEDDDVDTSRSFQKGRLIVAEASIKPLLGVTLPASRATTSTPSIMANIIPIGNHDGSSGQTDTGQMRVSLTGATFSGKSSLLGTLTTSALDNARGKSRLFLLKHRHEITTGQTSSISQELIGYRNNDAQVDHVEVINYATKNVDSWVDIHNTADNGRLVLFSDSAGHPRYRRTAIRSLVGWAPHWTLLCICGNNGEVASCGPDLSHQGDTSIQADINMSEAYLDLCMRLDLSLVVVITKLDSCSKITLRNTLAAILTTLKRHGRRPHIMSTPGPARNDADNDQHDIATAAIDEVQRLINGPGFDVKYTVPIVMSSAVNGLGMDHLHALLSHLPISRPVLAHDASTISPVYDHVFHVEEVYSRVTESKTIIVAGYLQRGRIRVGDKLYIGPLSSEQDESEDSDFPPRRRSTPTTRSLSISVTTRRLLQLDPKSDNKQEWQAIVITSIRNLRAAVASLNTDQAGTLGFKLCNNQALNNEGEEVDISTTYFSKGMAILSRPGHAVSTITARFQRDDLGALAVGTQVVIYVDSTRSTARVMSARVPDSTPPSPVISPSSKDVEYDQTTNQSEDYPVMTAGQVTHQHLLVTLRLEGARQFVQEGSKILIMPGGGPGLTATTTNGERQTAAALDVFGFVGMIVNVT